MLHCSGIVIFKFEDIFYAFYVPRFELQHFSLQRKLRIVKKKIKKRTPTTLS